MSLKQVSKLFIIHTTLLISGGIAGFVMAFYLSTVPWDFYADIENARQLGIVSKTVMSGYPKKRDLLTFALAFGLPVCGALAFWLPWGFKRRKLLSSALYPEPADGKVDSPLRPYILTILALLLVSSYFVLNKMYGASFNEYNGAWPFLGEEGVFLEWSQRILNGEVQGKDFFCLYGPLMVYPLALLQKIAGPVVSLGRWYAFGLNIMAYVLLAFVIHRTIRNFAVASFALLFMVAVFPHTLYSANLSPLRYFLGFWPIIPLLRYHSSGLRCWLVMAGMTVGVSFLFSQEVGMCAFLATTSFLVLETYKRQELSKLPRRFLEYFTGYILTVAPFGLYFFSKGALGSLLENMFSYPRLVMLGYGGLAFPSLMEVIEFPFSPMVFDNYWLVFVYAVAACLLITRITVSRIDVQALAASYVIIFGVLLFRSALARSSVGKAYWVSPPMFLILFIGIDYYLSVFKCSTTIIVKNAVGSICLFFILFMTHLSFMLPPLERFSLNLFGKERFELSPFGAKVVGVERDDVLHPPNVALEIQRIADFFSVNGSPGQYTYFFPNEPAYYFLFDKKNPTRYPMSSLMVTTAMRREAVADLEQNKPEFVVYSTETWRPDDIPERVQTPEVYEYLKVNYSVMEDHGAVVFLRRKEKI